MAFFRYAKFLDLRHAIIRARLAFLLADNHTMATKEEWLNARLAYLRGLKSPTEMQKFLMLLADKPDRTAEEEKKLNAVIRAERAAVFAAKARMDATNIVNNKDREKKKADKKARDHRLIELGCCSISPGLAIGTGGRCSALCWAWLTSRSRNGGPTGNARGMRFWQRRNASPRR